MKLCFALIYLTAGKDYRINLLMNYSGENSGTRRTTASRLADAHSKNKGRVSSDLSA